MTYEHLISLINLYGYPLLFPLALVEGHVVSLIIGFLARLGYINPYIGGSIIILGNLTGDIILYWLGHYKGKVIVDRWGKYLKITSEHTKKAQEIFQKHGIKILFFSKLTNGFGLMIPILLTAGMSKIKFKIFLLWNILGEVIWTSCLLILGFTVGHFYTAIENVFSKIAVITISSVLIFILFKMIGRSNPEYFI